MRSKYVAIHADNFLRSSGDQLHPERFEQAFAGVLALIERLLEAFLAAEVRIDDHAAVVARGEFHQQADLVAMLRGTQIDVSAAALASSITRNRSKRAKSAAAIWRPHSVERS